MSVSSSKADNDDDSNLLLFRLTRNAPNSPVVVVTFHHHMSCTTAFFAFAFASLRCANRAVIVVVRPSSRILVFCEYFDILEGIV